MRNGKVIAETNRDQNLFKLDLVHLGKTLIIISLYSKINSLKSGSK